MPPFGSQPNALNQLDDQQVIILSNWILKNYGNDPLKVSPQQVAEIGQGGFSSPLDPMTHVGAGTGALVLIMLLVRWLIRRKHKKEI